MNPSGDPVKILIVDDLEENLLALESLLLSEPNPAFPLRILKTRSGEEALNLLLDHDFAAALVDVQMPEMSGFELAELMRGAEKTPRGPDHLRHRRHPQRGRNTFRGYESGAVDFLYQAPRAFHRAQQKSASSPNSTCKNSGCNGRSRSSS